MKKAILALLLVGLLISAFGFDSTDEPTKEPPMQLATDVPENNETVKDVDDGEAPTDASTDASIEDSIELSFEGCRIITVDGGDSSGYREPNAAVDIGFGDREYWAFTNGYGQLVRVIAEEIIPQDESTEPVTSDGSYYNDKANVPGVELDNYDCGHVIADSLGGVSNAYNITPQDSTMNRYGDQAYMEEVIRDAGGCTDFEAIISYPDTKTQIPDHYHYTYTLMGEVIVEDFDNINPEGENSDSINPDGVNKPSNEGAYGFAATNGEDVSLVDTNGNGQVTIAEAKAAGYKMPISSDHWLYKYMDDRDGDGLVGE